MLCVVFEVCGGFDVWGGEGFVESCGVDGGCDDVVGVLEVFWIGLG